MVYSHFDPDPEDLGGGETFRFSEATSHTLERIMMR